MTLEESPPSRSRAWSRGLLAGPVVLLASCCILAGAALWIPAGQAQINNLAFPILLFPLIWTVLFLYAFLDRRLLRAYAVISILGISHAALIAAHLLK
jgi:hypothetical protein